MDDYKYEDFQVGTKVFLENEYGVIVNLKLHKFSTMIRWDTSDEKDFEDWSGMWGVFVQIGGKIIDSNYQFKYINDDGTLKIFK
ncbi:hypothetical protein SAMN05421866_1214 [Chryseobacterium oranimense]|uniref:Uncharacterized protein n=1 Tax=Chryseobacterium oranimense TaxID=421058 RepID=A0A1M5LU28_9FLAO|nr:hypothetical protein [Chryseobacterium oranimense]SHG68505.1 hypothetical protein SAMN05421866_1214 [Chryseobacterium oranimense]